MEQLTKRILAIAEQEQELPFAVYSSVHEQKLLNVPITKPLLVLVINGEKQLGQEGNIKCQAGDFVFLSDSPAINMRNIPGDKQYLALLIEFDHQDFPIANSNPPKPADYIQGKAEPGLMQCLLQFVESSLWLPNAMWQSRKTELLTLLMHLGYRQVLAMSTQAKISHKIHDFYCSHQFSELTLPTICQHLAMSESTVRRKLTAEGSSLTKIKDQARLAHALHLLQTTSQPIGLVAEQSGYYSSSRFTEKFKSHFGLTPSELRKTKMAD